jgi:pilus assembly protein Flp/PilA
MRNKLKRFAHDQSGATAIEYGLIAAGISVAIIAVVNALSYRRILVTEGVRRQRLELAI